VHILYGTEKRFIRDCIFQNFDDTFSFGSVSPSPLNHLVKHSAKRSCDCWQYGPQGCVKTRIKIILDEAYSGETSVKALFIPSLKSNS
jgi:hypothetical protein